MKLAIATLFVVSTTASALLVAEESSSFLRKQQDDESSNSSCNKARDRDSCFQTVDDDSQQPCEWCVAGAIPSECMSPAQAALLPAGVFDCAAPGETIFKFDSEVLSFGGTTHQQLYSLNVGGGTHQSDPQPSKSDLCDPSSASISGYMDIKGSEYDENGENKHLFFWMFEKRGDYSDDTPVSSFFLSELFLLCYSLCFISVCTFSSWFGLQVALAVPVRSPSLPRMGHVRSTRMALVPR